MEVYQLVLSVIISFILAKYFQLHKPLLTKLTTKPIQLPSPIPLAKPKLVLEMQIPIDRDKELLEHFNYLHIPKMRTVDESLLEFSKEFLEMDELDISEPAEESTKLDISSLLRSKKIEIPKYNKNAYRLDDDSFASSRASTPTFQLKLQARHTDGTPAKLIQFHQDKRKEWRELGGLTSIDEQIEKHKEIQYGTIYKLLEEQQMMLKGTSQEIAEMKKEAEKKAEERMKQMAELAKQKENDKGVDHVEEFRQKFNNLKNVLKVKEDAHWDFNGEVGKITSDQNDPQHLYDRGQTALKILISYTGDMETFMLFAADKLVTRALDNLEEREVGINFAINYTQFMMDICKNYSDYEEYCIVRIKTYRRIFIPAPFSKEKTLERYNLQDGNYKGLDTEDERQAFSREMDRTRGLAYFLGAVYTHPDSKYYIQEAWKWLYKVMEYPLDLVDRATLPALQGFIATCGKTMKDVDTIRWNQFIKEMKEEYFPKLKERFKPITHYGPYLTQLDQVLRQY
jgi:hypothetical protein